MTALFKNIAPGALLNVGDTVRLGFAQEHAYISPDATFANDFNGLWSKLFSVGVATPISRNAVVRGQTTAVVDFRVTRSGSTVAQFVNSVEHVSGYYVQVTSAELLSKSQGEVANTEQGAKEREAARAEDAKQKADESIVNKIAKGAGTALNVTKWLSVAIIVVALIVALIYAGSLKNNTLLRKA